MQPEKIIAGDVVFTSGLIDYYHDDPARGIGHVGIATDEGTVIHAANRRIDVVETPMPSFVRREKFRGIKRYLPKHQKILTLETPPERGVELEDDIRWIILQSLPRRS